MTPPPSQKRGKFERLSASIPIEIRLPVRDESLVVMCDNIGGKGMRFSLDQKIDVNTPLELVIQMPDQNPPIRTRARVSWVREIEGPKSFFDIGVEFLEMTFQDKDRIHRYIYHRVKRRSFPSFPHGTP